jgi:hypothetical protein
VERLDISLGSVLRLSGILLLHKNQPTPFKLKQLHLGMVIYYLLFFQFVIHLIGGLTSVLIFMCVLIFFFVFFQPGRPGWLLIDGEWGACGCSWCWYGRSEAHFGKDRVAQERASYPLNKEELH